jgi:Bacterial SH3 domain
MRRTLLALLTVSVTSAAAVLAGAAPAMADTYGGHATATVNIRNGPGTNYSVIGSLANGTQVHVYCVRGGTTVNGNPYWDYIGSGRYVSDAYIYTGFDVPIAQDCQNLAPGYVDVSVVPGCGIAGSFANSNFGAVRSPEADWFQESGIACYDSNGIYYFTYGNGPTASGDYVRWGYYPGAYAHCSLGVSIPHSSGHVFDTSAHYQILTGVNHNVVISDIYINQAAWAGTDSYALGTFYADGSGYLGVQLLDSSQSGSAIRVVANTLHFSNCLIASA